MKKHTKGSSQSDAVLKTAVSQMPVARAQAMPGRDHALPASAAEGEVINLPAEKDIELPDGVEEDSPEAMEYRLRKLFGDEMEAARNRIHSLEKQAEHLAGQIEQFKAIAEECRTQARLAHDALAAVQETQSRLEPQNCTRAMASLAAGIIVLSNQSGHPLSGILEHELTHLRDGKRL